MLEGHNIALKIAIGIHLLMSCSEKIVSQMVQV